MRVLQYAVPCSLLMKEEIVFETSVNFYDTTRRKIPEDSHLHTLRCDSLKSHKTVLA
jgi:hypothetical protein